MVDVRPFRGVRYDRQSVGDLSAVICPAYDVITPRMGDELYSRSQYNFVRLEQGRQLPQDTSSENKYTRSADTLEQWLEMGVLRADREPAIYLHDQYFMHQGKRHRRRGIIAAVGLEEWDKGSIRPHEAIQGKPMGDRLSLLWALNANTSPILALYDDKGERLSSLFHLEEQGEPVIATGDADGEGHTVWAITGPEIIADISAVLARRHLYIADGHHRYESALSYHREKMSCSPPASGEDDSAFVAMTLVSFSDPGLLILPSHRLVGGIHKAGLSQMRAELGELFEVEEVPLPDFQDWQRVEDFLVEKDATELTLVLFGLDREHLFLLRLRDFAATDEMMPYFHSDLYKRLDVSIIDHVILENMLGMAGDVEGMVIDYGYDSRDAVARVLNEEFQLALLLSPIGAATIRAIADAGDRLPKKSTYFYPKLPAGLVTRLMGR